MSYSNCAKCGNPLAQMWNGTTYINVNYYWINGQPICFACYSNQWLTASSPTYTTYTWPTTTGAWVCPKCGRVWSNQIWSCVNCNTAITEQEKAEKPIPIQPISVPKSDGERRGCASCKYGELTNQCHRCYQCLRNLAPQDKSLARDWWTSNQ